jgi:hypothetical protein
MYCAFCESSNQAEFNTEVMIHLSGLKSIDRPGVLVFPKVLVCLDCGFSRFTIPGTDLALLADVIRGLRPQPSNGVLARLDRMGEMVVRLCATDKIFSQYNRFHRGQ